MTSKLMHGFISAAAALAGKFAGGYVNSAVPQANLKVTSTKAINVASFAGGALVSGFGPKGGLMGSVVQGFGNGLAAGSDPNPSALGGGSVRYGGTGAQYGSIGI